MSASGGARRAHLLAADDPLAQPAGRRHGRERQRDQRRNGLVHQNLGPAHHAASDVRLEVGTILAVENAQGRERRQLEEAVFAHDGSGPSTSRSRSIAVLMRVFTVPSGSPRRAAISDCVKPS